MQWNGDFVGTTPGGAGYLEIPPPHVVPNNSPAAFGCARLLNHHPNLLLLNIRLSDLVLPFRRIITFPPYGGTNSSDPTVG